MPISPEDIEARQFAAIRRGYDPDEVDGFLAAVAKDYRQVADALEQAQADLAQERERPAALVDRPVPDRRPRRPGGGHRPGRGAERRDHPGGGGGAGGRAPKGGGGGGGRHRRLGPGGAAAGRGHPGRGRASRRRRDRRRRGQGRRVAQAMDEQGRELERLWPRSMPPGAGGRRSTTRWPGSGPRRRRRRPVAWPRRRGRPPSRPSRRPPTGGPRPTPRWPAGWPRPTQAAASIRSSAEREAYMVRSAAVDGGRRRPGRGRTGGGTPRALALQAANSVRTEAAASAQAITEVAARELDAAIRVRAEADQESETVRAQAAEHVARLIETARRDAEVAREARARAVREAEQIVAEATEQAARLAGAGRDGDSPAPQPAGDWTAEPDNAGQAAPTAEVGGTAGAAWRQDLLVAELGQPLVDGLAEGQELGDLLLPALGLPVAAALAAAATWLLGLGDVCHRRTAATAGVRLVLGHRHASTVKRGPRGQVKDRPPGDIRYCC